MSLTAYEWSQGNPGALTFLLNVFELNDEVTSVIIMKLQKAQSIRGTNLWVLYSDLCNKDISKVEKLCKDCPTDILEDACSRQDYSGRKLVSTYLES